MRPQSRDGIDTKINLKQDLSFWMNKLTFYVSFYIILKVLCHFYAFTSVSKSISWKTGSEFWKVYCLSFSTMDLNKG